MTLFAEWRYQNFGLICLLAIMMLAHGSNNGFAERFAVCSEGPTYVSELVFNPKNREFQNKAGDKFLLGNISFINLESYSATIRTQIDKQIEERMNKFLGLDNLSLVYFTKKPDRYGRNSVNIFAKSGHRWMQQELVDAGLAIVHPGSNLQECDALLFAAEKVARNKNVGMWRSSRPIIMSAADANWQSRVQNYQLVEGEIISVGETKSRTYLNFGTSWDNDFTVIVAKQHIKRFKKVFGDLKQLSGKFVRVRGWMINSRGPMIEIYHPGQIEIEIE